MNGKGIIMVRAVVANPDDRARSKNSCSFLIVVFEQGSRPFPESNGHVT